MKIEIKDRENRNYYDELLYITSNYKKIFDNPKKKAHSLSIDALVMGIISFVALILFIILYRNNNSYRLFLFGIYLFILLIVLSIVYYLLIQRRITKLRNVKGTITLEIEKEHIDFITKKSKYKVLWKDIKYVLINKHTICFIPKKSGMLLISLGIRYKEKVISALKDIKKTNLIIDTNI